MFRPTASFAEFYDVELAVSPTGLLSFPPRTACVLLPCAAFIRLKRGAGERNFASVGGGERLDCRDRHA